jgi:hypothetical protein
MARSHWAVLKQTSRQRRLLLSALLGLNLLFNDIDFAQGVHP